ncbi:hypothetical protein AYO38_06255 [bacterium SCGC AG-212-C10]|nr:hypothetical protein AYO38_06185 [bacterium SCGC AG-212-C10]OAI40216.1 hypothetical protein AYO38_06255 [bacterium SCGC AG-212-C10]
MKARDSPSMAVGWSLPIHLDRMQIGRTLHEVPERGRRPAVFQAWAATRPDNEEFNLEIKYPPASTSCHADASHAVERNAFVPRPRFSSQPTTLASSGNEEFAVDQAEGAFVMADRAIEMPLPVLAHPDGPGISGLARVKARGHPLALPVDHVGMCNFCI